MRVVGTGCLAESGLRCRDCFARWWRWEQRSLHGKRKQVLEDLGARAGPALSGQGLVPDAKGIFTVHCPSCRCAQYRCSDSVQMLMSSTNPNGWAVG